MEHNDVSEPPIDEFGGEAVADARAFDLIVIGAGSGNSIIGPEFDDLSVALIDAGEWFGGTCLNAGCIPTKMFVRVADVVTAVDHGDAIGVRASVERPDWASVRDRVFQKTDKISGAGFRYRDSKSPNVTVFRESFGFESPHVIVSASGERLTAPRIVVAAGSRPRPLLAHYEPDPAIHDSDSIMRIDERPQRLMIIGGGAVAVEFAHVFEAFGTEVSLVTRGPRLLAHLDESVSARFTEIASEKWALYSDSTVEQIERRGTELAVTLDDGAVVLTDAVLVAIGRVPNTDTTAAANAGFDLHDDGRLAVDEYQRVLSEGRPVDGVFALGDISNPYQLKHVANHEARLVAHNLVNPDDLVGGHPGPVVGAIFSDPQVAYVGLTQAEAVAAGHEVVSVSQEYRTTAYGWALEDTTSFCTIVVDPDGLIVGATIIGPEASILIQPLVQAASFGRSVHGLARGQYWPHPAASEVVENALLKAEEALEERRTKEQA